MLGANVSQYASGTPQYAGWPRCGEIDILETNGWFSRKYGVCLHGGRAYYDGYWLSGGDYTHDTSLADDFYIYGVKWDDSDLYFYLLDKDRNELYAWSQNWATREQIEFNNRNTWSANTDTYYTQDFCIIFNIALSGAYVAYEGSWADAPYLWAFEDNALLPGTGWQGDRATAPGAPELNMAYYNTTDQKLYHYTEYFEGWKNASEFQRGWEAFAKWEGGKVVGAPALGEKKIVDGFWWIGPYNTKRSSVDNVTDAQWREIYYYAKKYTDRTLQVEWVRVHTWERDEW
jgi:hypothetical protein